MNWKKYEDEPLIDDDNTFLMDFYFLAIVEANKGMWIAYCTIDEGGGLCYYENDIHEFEPAPWSVDAISYWTPFEYPAQPKQEVSDGAI